MLVSRPAGSAGKPVLLGVRPDAIALPKPAFRPE